MGTLLAIFSSILPGARSVRGPLISGLLWGLLIWISLAGVEADSQLQLNLLQQASIALSFLGPAGALIVTSVLLFILGALSTFASDFLSHKVGIARGALQNINRWQAQCRSANRRLKREIRESKEETVVMREALAELQAPDTQSPPINESRRLKWHEDRLSRLEHMRSQLGAQRVLGVWYKTNEQSRGAAGAATESRERVIATRIMKTAYRDAWETAAANLGYPSEGSRQLEDHEPSDGRSLIDEFSPDPVECLRSLDNALFVELDRARAERELRVAISLPAFVLSGYIAMNFYAPAVALCVISTLLFFSNSDHPRVERAQVLSLLGLSQLSTTSTRVAAAQGRTDLRRALEQDHRENVENSQR